MGSVPAAEHALAILSYLAGQPSPVAAAHIARELELPRSTTYHLLNTMVDARFVAHYPEQRAYGLGVTAYELGSGYMRQAPLQRLARRPMATLADDCGFSAHLSVLMGRDVVYVIEERAPRQPLLITDVGVRLPAQSNASGRSMLSRLPAPQVRALYADRSIFVNAPEGSATSLSALQRQLIDIRRAGYASENGEVTAGLSSVAMPVVDRTGHPLAAVAVTYPSDAGEATQAEVLRHVRATVALLTRRLGGDAAGPDQAQPPSA